MSASTYSTNADGLMQHYGTQDSKVPRNAVIGGGGSIKRIVYYLKATEIDTLSGSLLGTDKQFYNAPVIKAGSLILSSNLYVTTGFTSGGAATLTIGTYVASGVGSTSAMTPDDADGIDATIALAAMSNVGEKVVNDGAQVTSSAGISSDAKIGSSDVVVGCVYGTAVYTAGEAVLILEVYEPA